MRRTIAVAAMSLLLVIAGLALRADNVDQPSAGEAQVKIDNFTFSPQEIHVKAGAEVTWVNKDDIPHNIVSDDKSFKSKVLDTDDKFTYKPAAPGTYFYFCGIHPKMRGKIVVEK
jgi:amicyanin